MVARHVGEAEAGVLEPRHRVGATRVGVGPREEPVHQHGGLVAGHRALPEERAVGEARVELDLAQLAQRAAPPLVTADLTQADSHDQQDTESQ